MTDVRTFKAATMQEALTIVREEMGPEAVILHTRELPKPRLLRWMRANERVEITAGLGVNIRPPAARFVPRPAEDIVAPRRPVAIATESPPAAPVKARTSALPMPSRRPVDQELAPPPALLPERQPVATLPAARPEPPRRPALPLREPRPSQPATPTPRRPEPRTRLAPASAPQPRNLTPLNAPAFDSPAPVATLAPPSNFAVPADPGHAAIQQQLHTIRQMVEKLSRNAGQTDEIPDDLFQIYTGLIDAEIDEDLARDLVFRIKHDQRAGQPRDLAAAQAHLQRIVEADFKCARPIAVTPGRRKVVALVGPTGVGKTTTIAKLAANFRLRDGIKMGLVTVDTYRIAAVEQLRTYAEIIDLPMKVVTGPRDMRRALDELAGLDLVLIDTAGRSPRDELKIQELKTLLAEAEVDEVQLVLSMVASPQNLQSTAEKFAVANTTSLILTKLDEAAGMSNLLAVARNIPLPISYVTTGQNVPDDIEAATTHRMAGLVLGREKLGSKGRRPV